jgi:Spy/CpxP family protein refolding chaperone
MERVQAAVQQLREQELQVFLQQRQNRIEGSSDRQSQLANRTFAVRVNPQATGAWWTNAALVQQLGLTDDQKTKIERAYENHRQQIVSATTTLEQEEARLSQLLAVDTLDRNAILTQIDHVVQARGEVERTNSAMTLEMRENLTKAQWLQLQSPVRGQINGDAVGGRGRGAAPPLAPAAGQRRGPGGYNE